MLEGLDPCLLAVALISSLESHVNFAWGQYPNHMVLKPHKTQATKVVCRVALAAGSDDEEHFKKKDAARLVRDKLRLNPVVLGESNFRRHL